MTTPQQFFADNISRLNAHSDPLGWNLNHGLLSLSVQVAQIREEQTRMKNEIEQTLRRIEQELRNVQFQLRSN